LTYTEAHDLRQQVYDAQMKINSNKQWIIKWKWRNNSNV